MIRDLLFSGNVRALTKALRDNPSLANELISLPNSAELAHPLHRICDGVFTMYSEDKGLDMASVFIQHGADVNYMKEAGKDSALTAACSLYCDRLALYYIDQGATIDHRGCHGGTALHWASWCGRDEVVKKLLTMNPDINQRCIDFKSTPLFWAIHGLKFGGKDNNYNQVTCARLLLEHGADPSIPNFEGYLPKELVEPGDKELLELFGMY